MSEEKKTGPEAPPLKDLTKEHFENQIKMAAESAEKLQQQVAELKNQIQQQIGIIGYAQHILKTFKLPNAPKEEPKKKTDLEVK